MEEARLRALKQRLLRTSIFVAQVNFSRNGRSPVEGIETFYCIIMSVHTCSIHVEMEEARLRALKQYY